MALGQHVSGSHEHLKRVLDKGIVVATHYSGTGAAEMALAKIAPGRVKLHSACDLDPICRAVLLNHHMECAAEHAPKDLCQRPPPRIVDALMGRVATSAREVGSSCFDAERNSTGVGGRCYTHLEVMDAQTGRRRLLRLPCAALPSMSSTRCLDARTLAP